MEDLDRLLREAFGALTDFDTAALAEVHEIETEGDRVLVLGALRGRSVSGLPLDAELGWVARILDGKILKVRTYVDRDAARRDFRG